MKQYLVIREGKKFLLCRRIIGQDAYVVAATFSSQALAEIVLGDLLCGLSS